MMLTREQAAATWCPMVRAARVEEIPEYANNVTGKAVHEPPRLTVVAGCNTDALGRNRVPASCRCIADKCAMWRWGETKRTHETRVVDAPDLGVGGKRAIKAPVDVLTRGYCGLAGAPTIGSAS